MSLFPFREDTALAFLQGREYEMVPCVSEDLLLIERAQHGDLNAMDLLVRKYENRAYRLAFKLSRNSDDAADVVSESFVRVFRAIGRFKADSSFATWLYRIVRNSYLDRRKRERRRPVQSLEGYTGSEAQDTTRTLEDRGQSPYDLVESNEYAREIVDAVNSIPGNQKLILGLYCRQMLTYGQIAERLGLPVGTVKSRLNRARHSVRLLFEKSGRDIFGVAR